MKALGVVFVVLLVLVGAGLYFGMVRYTHTDDSASLEVRTEEIEQAADQAVEKAKETIDKTGQAIEDAGQTLKDGE